MNRGQVEVIDGAEKTDSKTLNVYGGSIKERYSKSVNGKIKIT